MGTLFFVILAVAAIFAIVRNLGRDDHNLPSQPFGNSPYDTPDAYTQQEGHFPPQIHIHNAYPMGGGYGGYGGGGYYPPRRGGWSTLLIVIAFGAGLVFFLSKSSTLENPTDVESGQGQQENRKPQPTVRPENPELNKIFKPRQGEAPTPRFTSLSSDGSPVIAADHWGVNIGDFTSETAANGAAQRVSDVTRLPQQMFLVTTGASVMLRMDCRSAAQAEAVRNTLLEYRSQLEPYCPDEPEVISW